MTELLDDFIRGERNISVLQLLTNAITAQSSSSFEFDTVDVRLDFENGVAVIDDVLELDRSQVVPLESLEGRLTAELNRRRDSSG